MLFGGQRTIRKLSICICSNIVYSNVFQRINIIDPKKRFEQNGDNSWNYLTILKVHLKATIENQPIRHAAHSICVVNVCVSEWVL